MLSCVTSTVLYTLFAIFPRLEQSPVDAHSVIHHQSLALCTFPPCRKHTWANTEGLPVNSKSLRLVYSLCPQNWAFLKELTVYTGFSSSPTVSGFLTNCSCKGNHLLEYLHFWVFDLFESVEYYWHLLKRHFLVFDFEILQYSLYFHSPVCILSIFSVHIVYIAALKCGWL